jgi:hypothetical protein
LSLVLFAVLSLAAFSIGRVGLGMQWALTPRYTTIGALGLIGLYLALVAWPAGWGRVRLVGLTSVVTIIVVGVSSAYLSGQAAGERWKYALRLGQYYVSTHEVQSDRNLAILFPHPKGVRDNIPIIERYKLSVFSYARPDYENLGPSHSGGRIHVDTINGRPLADAVPHGTVDQGREDTITISGWALDDVSQTTFDGMFMTVDDSVHIPILNGLERKDNAEPTRVPGYLYSGYLASFASMSLPKGRHTMAIRALARDGSEYVEATRQIVIEVR